MRRNHHGKGREASERRALTRHRAGPIISPLEEMERAVERFLPHGWPRPWRGEWPSWGELLPYPGRTPRVDMLDCENEVIVRAEVPGVNKEHMDVSVSDHTVTIRGDIRPETEGKGEYLCHKTTHGAFSRTIVFPLWTPKVELSCSINNAFVATSRAWSIIRRYKLNGRSSPRGQRCAPHVQLAHHLRQWAICVDVGDGVSSAAIYTGCVALSSTQQAIFAIYMLPCPGQECGLVQG